MTKDWELYEELTRYSEVIILAKNSTWIQARSAEIRVGWCLSSVWDQNRYNRPRKHSQCWTVASNKLQTKFRSSAANGCIPSFHCSCLAHSPTITRVPHPFSILYSLSFYAALAHYEQSARFYASIPVACMVRARENRYGGKSIHIYNIDSWQRNCRGIVSS